MRYACSFCHHSFTASAEGTDHALACPSCKSEAGLEPHKPIPKPMAAFAACLGIALTIAIVGSILSLVQ